MRSLAAVTSSKVTCGLSRRVATTAASLTRLARSAPVKPIVMAAMRSRSTLGSRTMLCTCTFKISRRPLRSGRSTAGPEQRGVENFWPVRRGKQYDAGPGVETVELGEELIKRLFLLVMAADAARLARAAEGVEFIDEDDAGRRLACLFE